jgi:CYTH domain-containing protein
VLRGRIRRPTLTSPMNIDPTIACSLGFPKPEYVAVERERRWLCRAVPRERVARTEIITDLYVIGTQLRLREARPAGVGAPMLRLSRKADVDVHTRLITSIYLSEPEFAILAAALQGARIHKLRHRLHGQAGISMLVDEFQGPLSGLLLVEAEFNTADALAAFPTPDYAAREVTDDARYRGGNLAVHGLPQDPRSASDS